MNRPLLVITLTAVALAGGAGAIWWRSADRLDAPVAPREPVAPARPIAGAAQEPASEPAPGETRPAANAQTPLPGVLEVGSGKPGEGVAGSWSGFRGDNRDAVSPEAAAIGGEWSAGAPAELWGVAVGEGFAGPAVRNGRVYLLDYDAKRQADALRCLSLADGAGIWRRWYSITLRANHGVSRTVPAVSDDFVVTLGPQCHVLCADARTGQALWSIGLIAQYGATIPEWYASQSPLIATVKGAPHAILAPGGKNLLVALDCRTGATTWATPNPDGWKMTHSSPVEVTFAGRRMFVYCFSGGIAAVDAESGTLVWKRTDWKISPANIATPIVAGDGRLVLCGGYNAGGMMIRMVASGDQIGTEVVWRLGKEQFSSYQQTPVLAGDHLYVVLDRDAGLSREQLVCMDLTGQHVWTSGRAARFGGGPYAAAGGRLFLLDDRGLMTVATASPTGYQQTWQGQVLTGSETWAPLAVAGGRLLARNMDRLVCLDVRPGAGMARAGLKPTAANESNRTVESGATMKNEQATGKTLVNVLVGVLIAAAVLAGILIVVRYDTAGTNVLEAPAPVAKTDPAVIVADEAGGSSIAIKGPRAVGLAVGPYDRIYVATDAGVDVYDVEGVRTGGFATDARPQALAVSDDEKIYLALPGRVEVFTVGGRREQSWPLPVKDQQVTSLAVAGSRVAAALYPAAEVVVLDAADGRILTRLTGRDGAAESGFVLRSAHFPVAFGPGGLLHVGNPGRFRVESYNPAWAKVGQWGAVGDALETFAECCNPVSLALLPDGRFVTCEKGITRVKLYRPDGRFAGVIAGPESFIRHDRLARLDQTGDAFPLAAAVDSRGRVWVLDPCVRELRRFILRSAQTRSAP
ncbi:MAG: PQQ-binding-like beta-propeller repeat protein [Planctomycetota bacterium]|nr:PQQ-binding-like beta-propeller repeat protein [Planctomycetota bacterium]